jgi:FKBP-type peptidyl-prolyl cis-trans isomerase
MLLFIKRAIINLTVVACSALLFSCSTHGKKAEYAWHPHGYYYKLISFSADTFSYRPGYMVQLAAGFYTQKDSLFWDSDNNLGDNFFIPADSTAANDFLKQYASGCAIGDSACLLIKTADFFRQQFKTQQVPFFSKNDSVVKVRLKVKQVLSPADLAAAHNDLQKKELQQIRNYYRLDADFKNAKDSLGFYWVQKPGASVAAKPRPGNVLRLWYRGAYLNGRFLEVSPEKFELVYGMPDQLLKGLNYVIGRIKIGQNAKIILPSRLAFGENGSTNGIIPPYTPLLYEIKIINVKE